jgi:general secretion pathway protein G
MKHRYQQGFSLIELVVVIVILGILASLVAPQIMGNVDKALIQQAKTDMKSIETALKLYKLDNFNYPTTEQGLEALVTKTSIAPEPRNFKKDGYLDRLPKDPWGREYVYLSPGDHGDFDIITYGRDGVPGGEDQDADIGNWETNN